MLKSAKSFLNTPVVSLYNSTKIGSLLDFVVEPNTGKIIGIVAAQSGIFKKKAMVISATDIREISKKVLIVDSEDVLVSQEEIIKIDEILKSGIKILDNKVFTEGGKYLGRVSDFLIDEFFYISKIQVRPSLVNVLETEIIILRESILKVTKDKIVVSDDTLERVKDIETVGATQ